MKISFIIILMIFVFTIQTLYGQTLDLGIIHASGKYRSMAGAGIGIIEGVSAIDLNPGGLAHTQSVSLSFSQNYKYYKYDLLKGGDGTIYNKGIGAAPFDWSKRMYNFENILTAVPINKNITLGIGFIQKINPFIYNRKRAITWSCMFHHDLYGSVYAYALSSGYKLREDFSVGITLYKYTGTIHSKIKGDNHGKDLDKWASLDNSLKGMNFRIGGLYKREKFSLGFVFESPYKMDIKTEKNMSEDRFYKSLFPGYEQTKWNMPLIFGVGFAYTGYKDWKFTLDLETRQYKESDVQLWLYEYAVGPNWRDINIVRTGVEFYPWKWKSVPLRIGYARIPQLYDTNISMSHDKRLDENEDTGQTIKHLFIAGTTFTFLKFSLNIGFEYSFLKWNRTFHTYIVVEDDYKESNLLLFTNLVYSLK